MEAPPEEVIPVLRKMRERGKGVYGMKVLGQGSLTHDPEKAIHYVLGLGVVDAITIGMTSNDQIRNNVRIIESFGRELKKAA